MSVNQLCSNMLKTFQMSYVPRCFWDKSDGTKWHLCFGFLDGQKRSEVRKMYFSGSEILIKDASWGMLRNVFLTVVRISQPQLH